MIEASQLAAWLRDSDEPEAARIAGLCSLNFLYVDTLFELFGGEKELELVDLNIEAPAKILREASGPLAQAVEAIERAVTDLAPTQNYHVRHISWVPLIPWAADPAAQEVTDALRVVDSAHVRDAWKKALERKNHDPDGAVTSARTLLEATAKHVLEKTGGTYTDAMSLPTIYHLTAQVAGVAASGQTNKLVKKVLGNCEAVVSGVAEMRNRLGDAHGKGTDGEKPTHAQAELAVNLAGAVALFLVRAAEGG